MQAAVAEAMAPAAPDVTMPASAPDSSASRRLARMLQLEDIDEVLGRGLLGRPDFRQLQRAAQIGPRAAAVDQRAHAVRRQLELPTQKNSCRCAGINRYGAEDERALRERSSKPLDPEFCDERREVAIEA